MEIGITGKQYFQTFNCPVNAEEEKKNKGDQLMQYYYHTEEFLSSYNALCLATVHYRLHHDKLYLYLNTRSVKTMNKQLSKFFASKGRHNNHNKCMAFLQLTHHTYAEDLNSSVNTVSRDVSMDAVVKETDTRLT